MNLLPADTTTRSESFRSTRWTLVLAAGGAEATPSQSLDALSELCRIYWRPLYLFLRRSGHDPADAQDLTQGFFADLIESRSYTRATQEKGRFRSFLLGALKHFVADEHDRAHAIKRGGGKLFQPLDEEALQEIESQFPSVSSGSADVLYEREWAAASAPSHGSGRPGISHQRNVRPFPSFALLPAERRRGHSLRANRATAESGHRHPAQRRGRLRSRFRAILREEVRGTLSDPAEVADELRYLCQVLAQA